MEMVDRHMAVASLVRKVVVDKHLIDSLRPL